MFGRMLRKIAGSVSGPEFWSAITEIKSRAKVIYTTIRLDANTCKLIGEYENHQPQNYFYVEISLPDLRWQPLVLEQFVVYLHAGHLYVLDTKTFKHTIATYHVAFVCIVNKTIVIKSSLNDKIWMMDATTRKMAYLVNLPSTYFVKLTNHELIVFHESDRFCVIDIAAKTKSNWQSHSFLTDEPRHLCVFTWCYFYVETFHQPVDGDHALLLFKSTSIQKSKRVFLHKRKKTCCVCRASSHWKYSYLRTAPKLQEFLLFEKL
jgi:hypothetical protein